MDSKFERGMYVWFLLMYRYILFPAEIEKVGFQCTLYSYAYMKLGFNKETNCENEYLRLVPSILLSMLLFFLIP